MASTKASSGLGQLQGWLAYRPRSALNTGTRGIQAAVYMETGGAFCTEDW